MGKPIKTIEDLKPDPQNLNRGTPRGHGVIEQSIRLHGAGRPGLAARDGTMIAGSQTLEEMAALGFEIVPVHTTGNQWPVHIRDDIEPGSEQARLMALEDNRASELGLDYDPALLAELAAETDLSQLFREEEMAALLALQPTDQDWAGALGLPTGDRAPFQQMTFTVSDEQAEQIKGALDKAKGMGAFVDTGNENSNGNALARVCEVFLGCS